MKILLFKQYPELTDENIFQIDGEGRISVTMDQDELWDAAQKIVSQFRSELRVKAAA